MISFLVARMQSSESSESWDCPDCTALELISIRAIVIILNVWILCNSLVFISMRSSRFGGNFSKRMKWDNRNGSWKAGIKSHCHLCIHAEMAPGKKCWGNKNCRVPTASEATPS